MSLTLTIGVPIYLRALLIVLACWMMPVAANAALPVLADGDEPAQAASADPSGALSSARGADEDARIQQRISGIFAEIPSLKAVSVEVRGGVATLSGTVTDDSGAERAEAIASRFNIAAVENRIERDVSVESGVSAITSLRDRALGLWRSLPLFLLAAAVALAIGGFGYLIAARQGLWQRLAPNPFLAEVLAGVIRFGFSVLGLVVALDMIGAGALLGAVLGGAGVVGIALGFAMRDTIENYVASLMLSLRQPFRANDHVIIEGHEGRVIRLTSRATILMTLDGNHVRIPNGQVFKSVIINFTRNPKRRFDFYLGVDADDDALAAGQVGVETLKSLPFVLNDPAPQSRIEEVGDSNIVIRFLGWIDQTNADWFKSRSRALAEVKQALEQGGFAMPEPIYRLRFDSRTGPLPLGRAADAVQSHPQSHPQPHSQPQRPPRHASASGDDAHDTRPESEIADMVAQDRGDGSGEQDLLDSTRPVE